MSTADASRFLAQSHSRLNNGNPSSSRASSRQPSSSRVGGRGFLSPPNNMPNPYQQRFPFSSRPANPAPLFHSTTEEFRDQDDVEELQRDAADLYALQKSRKGFGSAHLAESSEGDEEQDTESFHDETEESQSIPESQPFRRPRGRGLRSSWKGEAEDSTLLKGKSRLVDVELSESEHSSIDDLHSEGQSEGQAPTVGAFSFNPSQSIDQSYPDSASEDPSQTFRRPRSLDNSALPGIVEEDDDMQSEAPSVERHDFVWAQLFVIANATLLASAILVYLHTDAPSNKTPLGDTIYTILRKSYFLLAVDTIVAIAVAAIWLVLLRNFLRPLTYLIVYSVPIILFAFSLWPFITSFKGHWGGSSAQDKVMRIFSSIPFIAAIVWAYMAVQIRHSIDRAISIIQLASNILSASPSLFLAGFASLAATVVWFWVWLFMFTRVFLEGHWASSAKKLFIIDAGTWWLGVYFIMMLLWTQMTISGLHRAVTAAAVSQWYFYRHVQTTSTSQDILIASFNHATGPLLGTVTLSSLISLLIRLPLIVLPRRVAGFAAMCLYTMIPAPLASLTNPLTLTYAAVHSQSLATAARSFSRLPLSSDRSPTGQYGNQHQKTDTISAFRTTHMLLHATRQIMALALGLGAWLSTARLVHVSGVSYAGSAYAYIVGLSAAVIGWGILGAIEGIIGGVVDAVFVCWVSEVAAAQNGGNRGRVFCREAEEVFSDRWEDEGRIRV
jgi:hypothetical protein